jgi:hypothetical protein
MWIPTSLLVGLIISAIIAYVVIPAMNDWSEDRAWWKKYKKEQKDLAERDQMLERYKAYWEQQWREKNPEK